MIVIDASTFIAVILKEKDTAHAYNFYREATLALTPMVAPALFWYEVCNTLVVSLRRKRISSSEYQHYLKLANTTMIQRDTDADMHTITTLAQEHQLSVYDAAYLELALRKKAHLATLDAALANTAKHKKLRLVFPV